MKDVFCRTCMKHLEDNIISHNIFQNVNFADKLMQCTNLQFVIPDEFPQSVCENCYQQVLDFHEFRKMCLNSLEKFKNILECQLENDLEKLMTTCDPPMIEQETLNAIEEVQQVLVQNPIEPLDETVAETGACSKVKIKRKICSNLRDKCEKVPEYLESDERSHAKNKANENLLSESSEKGIKTKDDVTDEKMSLSGESASKIADGSILQCEFCPKTFLEQNLLETHQRNHKGLPPYSCTHGNCERSFNRWHFFQEHLKQHKEDGSDQIYKCDIDSCERVYKTKSALNIHKRKCHNCGPELKSHMCEICGKVFKSSAVLSDHRFTHVDKSQLPYVCDENGCTKKFSNKEKLKVHKMRHAGIKNYICSHCGMRKTTRNELKIHINYHTLERTWPCRFCSKVCNSAGNLKMHVRNIHERARDFACRFCDTTFAKADTRKYHEMTHTGEKPHACDECGRRFLQPAALRTHRKLHLKEKAKTTQCERDTKKDKSKKMGEKIEILECTTILETNS